MGDYKTVKTLQMLLAEAHAFLNAQCIAQKDYEDWERRYKDFTASLDRATSGEVVSQGITEEKQRN